MSTRCEIGYMNTDGTIGAFYCHYDGYIKGGVGEDLYKFYEGEEKRNKSYNLVAIGDMAVLGAEPDLCKKYVDDTSELKTYYNEEEYIENFGDISYRYLYMRDGHWYVAKPGYEDYKSLSSIFNGDEEE